MKARYLNLICVPFIVGVLILLFAGILGAGLQVLYFVFDDHVPDPILAVVTFGYVTMVLSFLVWLSLGKKTSIAIGRFCILVVCAFAILHWLVSYFRIWPQYAIYVVPLVSVYLVLWLHPSCLDGMSDTMKDKQA